MTRCPSASTRAGESRGTAIPLASRTATKSTISARSPDSGMYVLAPAPPDRDTMTHLPFEKSVSGAVGGAPELGIMDVPPVGKRPSPRRQLALSFGERYPASYENFGAGADPDLPVEPAGPAAPAGAHQRRAAHDHRPRPPAGRPRSHRLPRGPPPDGRRPGGGRA